MSNWRAIWNKREAVQTQYKISALLKLDGYDTGAGIINEAVWANYVSWLEHKLGIQDDSSIFELGCGAGALLYQLQKSERVLAGWDFAKSLIEVASTAMPKGDFEVRSASALNELADQYNFMLANSVFQYFPDEVYAKRIVKAMVLKANIAVGILDIYDAQWQQEMEHKKRQALGEEIYAERYKDLRHFYYDRQWFRDMAQELGLVAEIFDQKIELAEVSAYRFNVIIRKA